MTEQIEKTALQKYGPIALYTLLAFLSGGATMNIDRLYNFVVTGEERLAIVEQKIVDLDSRLQVVEKISRKFL